MSCDAALRSWVAPLAQATCGLPLAEAVLAVILAQPSAGRTYVPCLPSDPLVQATGRRGSLPSCCGKTPCAVVAEAAKVAGGTGGYILVERHEPRGVRRPAKRPIQPLLAGKVRGFSTRLAEEKPNARFAQLNPPTDRGFRSFAGHRCARLFRHTPTRDARQNHRY
jgi:hypothetical protein